MIFYISSTGDVKGGTGSSDLSGITHLPDGAEYAIYIDDATLQSLNPNNQPGTYTFTEVAEGPVYTVPTATGDIAFTPTPDSVLLADAQQAKITELRSRYSQTLADGFTATIGRVPYTFGWSTDDKTNLDITQTSIDRGFLAFPIQYADINGHPVTFATQTDLDTVEQTATRWFNAQHQQILNMIGQAQAATTVDALNAIQWAPAPY